MRYRTIAVFVTVLATVQAGAVAQSSDEVVTPPPVTTAVEEYDFHIEAVDDVELHLFNVLTPGRITVHVAWEGESDDLEVQLTGRRRPHLADPTAPHAETRGGSELKLAYEVTDADLERGVGWRLVIRDRSGAHDARGRVTLSVPADPEAQERFERERIRLRGGDLWPSDSGTERVQKLASRDDGVHGIITLTRACTCDEHRTLERAGFHRQTFLPDRSSFGLIEAGADPDDPSVAELIAALTPLDPEDKVDPRVLVGDYHDLVVRSSEEGDVDHVRNPDGTVQLSVAFHPDTTSAAAEQRLSLHAAAFEHLYGSRYVATVERDAIVPLAEEDAVAWIEPAPLPMLLDNGWARTTSAVDDVTQPRLDADGAIVTGPDGLPIYDGYTGDGVVVSVYERLGIAADHPDLNGKVLSDFNIDSGHKTHIAGTIAGTGVNSGGQDRDGNPTPGAPFEYRGMAPGATLWDSEAHSSSPAGIAEELRQSGPWIEVSNHSYTVSLNGDYDGNNRDTDRMIAGDGETPRRAVVKSAGNNGFNASPQRGEQFGYFSTSGQFKNAITVGNWCGFCAAVDDPVPPTRQPVRGQLFRGSSMGPAYDGRILPTVVAHGTGVVSTGQSPSHGYENKTGTSMAAPVVSGVVALVLEAWKDLYVGDVVDPAAPEHAPLPSTIRAILVQTATDVVADDVRNGTRDAEVDSDDDPTNGNDRQGTSEATPGPDYLTGWGVVDASSALRLVTDARAVNGALMPNRIAEGAVTQGRVLEYDFAVTPGTPVKVTLAWDDVAASEASWAKSRRLVNDLDLELVAPDDTVYYPWQLGHRIFRPDGTPIPPAAQTPGTPIRVEVVGPRPTTEKATFTMPPPPGSDDPTTVELYNDQVTESDMRGSGPWVAATGRDHLNNIEQVVVGSPIAGRWKARVIGFDVRTELQDFSLVGMPYPPLADLVPQVDEQVAIAGFDQALEFSWRVRNQGDGDQSALGRYRVLLSRDLEADDDDVELVDDQGGSFPAVMAGAYWPLDSTIRVSAADAAELLDIPESEVTLDRLLASDPFLLVDVDPDDDEFENHEGNNVAPIQVARLVDVQMVFDRSGSMSGEVPASAGARQKIDQLRDAGRLFYRLMRLDASDRVGQVSFAGEPRTDLELTAIGRDNVETPFVALLSELDPGGKTDIRGALETALDGLPAAGSDGRRRVIVFLSDGSATAGGDPGDVAFLERFRAEDARVYAVGFGTRGGSGYAGIDTVLLELLASAGDGGFFHVTDSPAGLAKFFVEAVAGATGTQTVIDPVESLGPRRSVSTDVGVTSEDTSVAFVVTWDDPDAALDVSVRTPAGTVLRAADLPGSGPGATAAVDPASAVVQVPLPLTAGPTEEHAGTWQLVVDNATDGTVEVATTALAHSTLRAATTIEPPEESSSGTPQPVTLGTTLTRRGGTPLVGADVVATSRVPLISVGDAIAAGNVTEEELATVPTTRDGEPLTEVERLIIALARRLGADPIPTGEGPPVTFADLGDGTYGGSFADLGTAGPYAFTVRATFETDDCDRATRETERTVGIDLTVDPDATDITLTDGGGGDHILQVTPRDATGDLLGPGHDADVVVTAKGSLEVDGPVVDRLDGSYELRLRPTGPGSATVSTVVDGVALPTQTVTTGVPAAVAITPAGGGNDRPTAIAIETGHGGDPTSVTAVRFVGPGGEFESTDVQVDAQSGVVHTTAPAKMAPGPYQLALVTKAGVGARSAVTSFRVVDPDTDPDSLVALRAAIEAVSDGARPQELVTLLHALWELPTDGLLSAAEVDAAAYAALVELTSPKSDLLHRLDRVASLATADARFVPADPVPTPTGDVVAVDLGNGLAATFDAVAEGGQTGVELIPSASLVTGSDDLTIGSTVYDVTSTATFDGEVTLTVPYDERDFDDETDLRVLHFDGDGWDDVTVDVDTEADTITARTTSLSPFVVVSGAGVPSTPAPVCRGLPATIVGTAGADVLTGTDGRDVIAGLDGDDVIRGLGGDDVLCGGPGDDTLVGGDGDDILVAGAGDDDVDGGNGNDRLDLGSGADAATAGNGRDVIDGGAGDDAISGDRGDDVVRGGAGHDQVDGGDGDDLLRGGTGDDVLSGGRGDDVLWGDGGDDVLDGGGGEDRLDGHVPG